MITIGEAQISDISSIKNVLSTTWRDTYRSFLSESVIKRVTSEWHSPQTLRNEIDRDSTYMGVAKSDHDIVAMITAHQDGLLLYVSRLYVLPAYQRQGIGYSLLEASYSAFPTTERVRLDVEEQNPVGRAFYLKLGFTEVDQTSDDVFGTVLHSIVMEREIVRNPT